MVLLLFIFLASCKKDSSELQPGPIKIYGQVLDSISGLPVSDVWVTYTASYGLWNTYSETLAMDSTDANGNYSLQWDQPSKLSIGNSLSFYKIGYSSRNFEGKSWAGNININIKIVQMGYVKIHAKNVNPYNTDDHLWVSYYQNNGTYHSIDILNLEGMNIDTTVITSLVPYKTDSLVFQVYKHVINTSTDTIITFLPADTVFIEYNY